MEEGESSSGLNNLKSRPYQAQLEEIAVKNNTIIYLPTGSGKTFIAIRLIKRFREALRKPWGEGGKRSFFLVNNIPLVNQQRDFIKGLCHVTVAGYSGEDGVDYWDKAKWDAELETNEVIVMTSQILSDMLTHKYICIEDINLLIFDECHHGVEDHPMRVIMKHFEDCHIDDQPRVLGLTATLLNANVSPGKVEATLRELETTFHASIATVNELGEVLDYSTNPQEMVLYYRTSAVSEVAQQVISKLEKLQALIKPVKLPQVSGKLTVQLQRGQHDISSDPRKIVKMVTNMIAAMIKFIEELGVYGGSIGILAYLILLERLKRKTCTKEEEKLYNTAITHCTHSRAILLQSMENERGYNKIVNNSSEKVLLLLNTLKEYSPAVLEDKNDDEAVLLRVNRSRKPLSAIIFAKQRFTAKVIFNLLKDVKEANPREFGFLQHDFVVGFNVNPTKNTREDHYHKKASQYALLKFKNSDLNCLISTSVIEEGVDIPQCLLVLRYDKPLEYRSYIQSKGRARSNESSYVMLIADTERESFAKKYLEFQRTEQIIQRILVGSSDLRNLPELEDIKKDLYDDDDVAPFITPNGGRLNAVSAISLLNRYCSMLPHDQFTVITPMWIQQTVNQSNPNKPVELRQVIIIMPIACPIKEEIQGIPQDNLKSAKRSAALNACIRLYEAGELEYDTLLPQRYTCVDFEESDVKGCFPNWPSDDAADDGDDVPKPGTKKRMRKHQIQFPSCLDFAEDVEVYYLHVINLSTAFARPTEPRERALYDLLQLDEGFGFLTQKPLPNLCEFPMFMTVGEVTTSIDVNSAVVRLSPKLLKIVKEFHYFIFDQVLAVAKKFVIFEGKVNTLYVVPVQNDLNGCNIDWELMTTHQDIEPVGPPSYEERTSLNVTEDNYKYCVVTPWYREMLLPDRYIVSNVLEYKTSQSQFDQAMTLTFADYYAEKYKLEIMGDKNQPLLEVRNISSRMNCLLPRAATIKSFTDKQRKLISLSQGDDKTSRGFSEIFVAEFCIKYEFPGVLWYKAILLPSILHRLHMLLVAEELLMIITKDIKYGPTSRSEGWMPIEANHYIAVNSLLAQVEEPTPIHTIDRINNPVDGEVRGRLNIMSMKESVYHLQQKKINKEYPWDAKMEPLDVERNLSTVTLMDLECYDEFISAPLISTAQFEQVRSPPRTVPMSAAISAPPLKYVDKIKLLEAKPSNKGPELRNIVGALTTIKSHDTFDLERTETLGDSFLKFAASLYLYHKFPKKNEGQLTNIKGRLVSNRNLYYASERFNLGGRMKVEQFSPRKDFLVPGYFAPAEVEQLINEKQIRPTILIRIQFSPSEALSGQLTPESSRTVQDIFKECDGSAESEPAGCAQNAMQCYVHHQAVSDKTVADCVEALVGTYLLSGGVLAAIKLLEWMRVIPPQDNLAHLLHKRVPTVLSEKKATPKDIDFLMNHGREDVEKIIKYKFQDTSFLLEALSHPSYIRNRLTRSYERLEFLGDAILDFLITAHIFENCPDLKPGEITDLRSALVNNVTFASYVVKLGLHKFLCSELNPNLDKAIINFEEHQRQRDHEIIEDVLYLIDEEECQVAEYIEVPKVLSDIWEALVGAIYLDTGGDLHKVWAVVYRIMCNEIHAFSARIPQQPVKVLYEMIHACPVFGKSKVIDPDLPRILVPVTITKNGRQHTVYGAGRNKSQAKRAAAKMALKVLSL